jgi:hypothetical protein
MADLTDRALVLALAVLTTGCGFRPADSTTSTTDATVSTAGASADTPAPTADATIPAATGTASTTSTVPSTTGTSSSPATTPATTPPTGPTSTTPATVGTSAPADPRMLALDLLSMVRVEREHRGGYERDFFGYPARFGGGCDTRDEVLQRDSQSLVQMDPVGCTVVAGDWYSPYDDLWFETPQDIEIDHVVALKEAWDSGAWQWGTAALEAFGNDLTDPRTLRAVSGDSNREKSDKDPSNWLPRNAADVCRFAGDWTAIKARWGLSMDESEHGRLRNLFRGPCAGLRIDPITPTPVPVP